MSLTIFTEPSSRSLTTVKVMVWFSATATDPDGVTDTNVQPAGMPAAGSVTAHWRPVGMLPNVSSQPLASLSTRPMWSYAVPVQSRFTVNSVEAPATGSPVMSLTTFTEPTSRTLVTTTWTSAGAPLLTVTVLGVMLPRFQPSGTVGSVIVHWVPV